MLVLDSYELDPAGAGALRAAGVYALAIIDGDNRGQVADLYLDQNFGAELPGPGAVPGLGAGAGLPGRLLAGSGYALLRDTVISARPPVAPPATAVGRPGCWPSSAAPTLSVRPRS